MMSFLKRKAFGILCIVAVIFSGVGAINAASKVADPKKPETTTLKAPKISSKETQTSKSLKKPGTVNSASPNEKTEVSTSPLAIGIDFEESAKGDTFYDPYEKFNRTVFKFNYVFNYIIMRPFAEIYSAVLPNFVQKGVNNFFNNIGEVPRVASDILQGDIILTMTHGWRFIINSTAGIFGLFDVAAKLGLERKTQDLGITFAKWGAKNTPYFLLPILGPSTVSDGISLVFDYYFLSLWTLIEDKKVRYWLLAVDYVDIRANLLIADKTIREAFDPYIAERNAYLQYRAHLISEYGY